MNRIIIFVALSILSSTALCQTHRLQVSESEASQAALSILSGRKGVHNASVTDVVRKLDSNSNVVMYDVQTSSKISVLLSGNKSCLPLLGIYDGSRGPLLQDSTNVPNGLQFLLDWYSEQIEHCFVETKMDSKNGSIWDSIVAVCSSPSTKTSSSVAPLTTSRWGQKYPNMGGDNIDAYNYYIPAGGTCLHQIAGCVAVAMGQLMYYWKYPVWNDKRVQQFDWCNMSDSLIYNSENYEANRNAIAFLLYDCGLMANMNYGCEVSLSKNSFAASALNNKYNFDYPDQLGYKSRNGNESDWTNMIKNDLDNGYPVIYGGGYLDSISFKYSGHTFICDGYNDLGLFHFNWGWNGDYNDPDNYYNLDELDPYGLGDYNYKYYQNAIFGVHPRDEQAMCDITFHLEDYYSVFAIYEHLCNPLLSYIPQTMTHLISASDNSDSQWRTIENGNSIEYVAHKSVTLKSGFHAERGSDFVAKIVPCPNCDNNDRTLSKGGNAAENMNTDINEKSEMFDIKDTIAIVKDEGSLFPNPCKEKITYRGNGVDKVFVYDITGKPVYRWFVLSKTDKEISLDIKNIKTGLYLLYVVNKDGSHSVYKFVKE